MNAFSFQEDEEPRELHSLQQEIGSEYIDSWTGNSQERVEEDYDNEIHALSHFDMNIPSLGDIPENINKQTKICEEACEVLNEASSDVSVKSEEKIEQEGKAQATQTSSQGPTFFEQTSMSTTVAQGSAIQEKWKKESGKALNEFIQMSESIYTPMLLNFKKSLQDTKRYSDKTMQNLNMYYLFFSIKLDQQKERCKILQNKKEILQEKLKDCLLLDSVYLDERVVIQQMLDRDDKRIEAMTRFCQKVQESCSKLKMLLSKALEFRTKKIDHISSYIERTGRIQKELIDLMVNPPSERDENGWMGKPDIRCDRYLQRKYLQQRERLFLTQLKGTGQKIIALMHSIFIKEEPIICSILGKEMQRYNKLNKELYGNVREYQESTKVDMKKVQEELKLVLIDIIPKDWREEQAEDEGNSVEDIINAFYAYLQNQIFLPTVVIEDQLILLKETGKWLTNSEVTPQKEKSKKTVQVGGKENQLEGANQPTCAALMSQRGTKEIFNKIKGMQVTIVLTADKYLHLECGQKIACLKLKRLKMNRKSDRKIVLNQRRGSISTLFAPSPYLGELIFQSEAAADAFIGAVLSTDK